MMLRIYAVLLIALIVNHSWAIKRSDLLTQSVQKEIDRIEVKHIEMEPGEAGGPHSHPCPVSGHIVKGEAILEIEGEKPRILKAGDAFYEPANAKILKFDNNSKDMPLNFVAVYLAGKDDKELVKR